MAVASFTPSKDTTIYQSLPLLNSGLDSILELTKDTTNSSRILIQFDTNEISQFVTDNNITGSHDFYLNLYTCDVNEIPYTYTVECYPISQSWNMGIGKRDVTPYAKTAANWRYRTDNAYWGNVTSNFSGSYNDYLNYINLAGQFDSYFNGNIVGMISGTIFAGSTYRDQYDLTKLYVTDELVSQSFNGKLIGNIDAYISSSVLAIVSGTIDIDYISVNQGGYYDKNTVYTQSFEYENTDLNIKITGLVDSWITGSLENNGVLLKLTDTEESASSYTSLKYFSRDTHTIYPPRLELRWNDNSFVTSSIVSYTSESVVKHSFASNKTPITDFSFFYPPFDTPVLPTNVTYSYSDSASYTSTHISESRSNDFDYYVSDYYLTGKYRGLLNGRYNGIYSGILSGSVVPFTAIDINNTFISNINHEFINNEQFDGYFNGSYSGSINGGINAIITASNGLDNTVFVGNIIGAFNYFSGSYSGSFNGVPDSGVGIITSSTNVTASLDGIFNDGAVIATLSGSYIGAIDCSSYIGSYSSSLSGVAVAYLSGSLSGSLDYPFTAYTILNSNTTLDSQLNNITTNATYITSSGYFTGYSKGQLVDGIDLFQYNITGSRTYIYTQSVSLNPLTENDIVLYLNPHLAAYNVDSINRINIVGRERYPQRTYSKNESSYLEIKYLPSNSYYSILDAHSNDIIVPFDDVYTKISCDETGNYFTLYTKGLQVKRHYRFVFKIVRNGQVNLYDEDFIFKVI
jgi:hypothetical protein